MKTPYDIANMEYAFNIHYNYYRTMQEKEKYIDILLDYIKSINAFSLVSKDILNECVCRLKCQVFAKDSKIISKGQKPQEVYIIFEGNVLKTKDEKENGVVKIGQ